MTRTMEIEDASDLTRELVERGIELRKKRITKRSNQKNLDQIQFKFKCRPMDGGFADIEHGYEHRLEDGRWIATKRYNEMELRARKANAAGRKDGLKPKEEEQTQLDLFCSKNRKPETMYGRKKRWVKRNAGNASDGHTCHWPGCTTQVAPALWGCYKHWMKLPTYLRKKIWATYQPGQEIEKNPSQAYLDVATEVQEYARNAEAKRTGNKQAQL